MGTMGGIRAPAVAGLFYPAAPEALRQTVATLLAGVGVTAAPRPRALIAPHAGYVYSGRVAAPAYARLAPWRDRISRVILLGPPHRVAVPGIATSSARGFATPLGDVALDADAVAEVAARPAVGYADRAHVPEHSLEVQLPFLQTVLARFTIVPLLVGAVPAAQVAQAIAPWWDAEDSLIVVSTDLSHYLDYDAARASDARTDAAIMALDPATIGPDDACGAYALRGLLHLAHGRGATIERLMCCNSGDTAGDRTRVVGYAAYALG
jgi:AmmeMemoRadiSam system protein B